MPKSKRDKKVSLTKTKKHGMDWKKKLMSDVQTAAGEYESIFVFRVIGMRISGLNELRKHFRSSKLFLGKNKIVALALGKDKNTELRTNAHLLSERLEGECGLLFTNEKESDIVTFLEEFKKLDFARSGTIARDTVVLDEGPLEGYSLSHAMEPHLRSLGMPTSLQKGVITLVKEFTVCKKGQMLNPEQAKILKLLGIQMSEFRIILDCRWTQPDDFKEYPQREVEVIQFEDDENDELILDEDEQIEDDFDDMDDDNN